MKLYNIYIRVVLAYMGKFKLFTDSCRIPEVSHPAINILMPFGTTYLSERSFSTYVATKTKSM